MTIFAPAARRGLFVDWAFFDGSEISSEFVGGQCASWRFPPKAAVSACSRHSFVEGKRNGGLEMFFKTAGKDGISKMGAQNHLSQINSFFFPRPGQIIHYVVQNRCALIGFLYFFLQFLKGSITNGVLHPASLLFRCFQINAGGHKLLRKKQVAFIDFLGNFPAYVS